MASQFTSSLHRLLRVAAALVIWLAIPPVAAQRPTVQPIRAGDLLPAATYKVFNPRDDAMTVDLADYLGKQPIALLYWIPGNPRAEKIFSDLLAVTRELDAGKLAVFGVAVANPGIGVTPDVIRERAKAIGVDVPILNDDEFELGKRLQVRSVPNLSIIDRSGRMRLSNGASLSQDLEYKVDVTAAIHRVAQTGDLHTYGYLPAYYPVREMEGRPSPDFTAMQVRDGKERSWSTLLDEAKVNVLIFWSVDCPHCRKQLPEINAWFRDNTERTNLIGCASITDDKDRSATREFCEKNDLVFPNLFDPGSKIGRLYGVTTTPTLVIVGPDGVVNRAITSSIVDFGAAMQRKQKELLAP